MKAILFDMDGVLYDGPAPVEGAAGTLRWVRARAIPHLFVTNTSSRARAALVEKLDGFGIEASPEDILTPPMAACQWLRDQPGPVALFVPEATRSEFQGLDLLDDEAVAGARYVVIGDLGAAWTFDLLNRAFRLLMVDPEARLISLGGTRYWLAPGGLQLDVAPFAAALECATGRQAIVFGKPSPLYFQAATARLGVAPEETTMIGDDIRTDIEGAQRAGLKGVLVQTGKFRPSDLDGDIRPDAVLASIADLRTWWT